MRIQNDFWGVRFDQITLYSTGLSKQCRPRSDAAKRGVWSGSTLFATHAAISQTLTGSKIDTEEKYKGKSKVCEYLG